MDSKFQVGDVVIVNSFYGYLRGTVTKVRLKNGVYQYKVDIPAIDWWLDDYELEKVVRA